MRFLTSGKADVDRHVIGFGLHVNMVHLHETNHLFDIRHLQYLSRKMLSPNWETCTTVGKKVNFMERTERYVI